MVAIPLLQDLLAQKSYYAPANLLLGKILIVEKNDISGIRYIESAAKCDNGLTISSYQLLIDFLYYEFADPEQVKQYQNEVEQHHYRMFFSGSDISHHQTEYRYDEGFQDNPATA